MSRSARLYQATCLLAAAAVLVGAALPAHRELGRMRSRLVPPAERAGNLRELDSFAMGLMLGGFRGPLVIYLWVTMEEEKNRDQTEKFLTRSELIGDLQPQFTAIYVHQSWNLAYNVSVQYNRPTEKYHWIAAGIEFAEKGERRIPNNTDILTQLGHLYFDKLGESFERGYYRTRFRHDSLEQLLDADRRLKPEYARRWRHIDRLDGLLDQARRGDSRSGWGSMSDHPPDWLASTWADLAGEPSRHRWPYGLSVFAVAFDYFRQAALTGPHQQFGPTVVSSRPGIACRAWLTEELELAALAESRLWPSDKTALPLPVPTAPPDPSALDEAVFHYREAQAIARLGRASYQAHLARHPDEGEVFVSHLNDIALKSVFAEAGENRLGGLAQLLAGAEPGSPAERAARQKLAHARDLYLYAIRLTRDYIATEYRQDWWAGEDVSFGRAPYNLLIDQSRWAVDQINRLLAGQ